MCVGKTGYKNFAVFDNFMHTAVIKDTGGINKKKSA